MLVGRKYSGDPTVTEPPHRFHRIASAVRGRLDSLPLSSYRKTEETYWTLGWLPNRIDRAVQEIAPTSCTSIGPAAASLRSTPCSPCFIRWVDRKTVG